MSRNRQIVLPAGLLTLAFALRLFRLDAQSLWWDEASSVLSAALPPAEMWQNLLQIRVHAPLYFLLLRPFYQLSASAFALRATSVLAGLLGVALIWRAGTLFSGGRRRVGWLAALLLAVAPFHIWYSQELRMYTLLVATILAAQLLLWRWVRGQRLADWAGQVFFLAVSLYVHYYALLVALGQYVFFSLRYRRFRPLLGRWAAGLVLVGLLFSPWAIQIATTGGFEQAAIAWIPAARWVEPLLTLVSFSAGPTVSPGAWWLLLPAAVAGVGLITGAVAWRREPAWQFLAAWLAVPLVVAMIISLDLPIPDKRSIYMDRYLILSQPAFLLLVAWGLDWLGTRRPRATIAAGLIGLLALVPALSNLYFSPAHARLDWRAGLDYYRAGREAGDILLLDAGDNLMFAYYGEADLPVAYLPPGPTGAEIAAVVAELDLAYRRLWVLRGVHNTDAHGFSTARNAQTAALPHEDPVLRWLNARAAPLATYRAPGVLVAVYPLPP